MAVIAPFLFTVAKTATEVEAGRLGVLEAFRGGGPVVLWLIARGLAPPMRKGHGLPEIALGVFILSAAATVLLPHNPSPAVTALKVIQLVGAYLALGRLVRMYPTGSAAITAFANAVHFFLLLVAVQWMLVPDLVYTATSSTGPTRLNSLVPRVAPNPLAFAAFAGLLAIVLRIGPAVVVRRTFPSFVVGGIYLVELTATRTRSALAIGLLIILLGCLAQVRRRPQLVTNLILMICLLAIWWLPRYENLLAFLSRGQSYRELQSLTGRTDLWGSALEEWADHRFLGLGYYTGHRLGLPGLSEMQSNLDSTWIESLLDVGLLGTSMLAIFVSSGFFRLLRQAPGSSTMWWGSGVAGYGVAISFVNPTAQTPDPAMLMLGLPLLASALARTNRNSGRAHFAAHDLSPAPSIIAQRTPAQGEVR